jgi:Domain of unknown function (DUF4407)
MNRTYYETPKPSKLMLLFWKIAGADRYLLEKATYQDQIKYFCLGGIILATGVMAALAGGYAFYTIFSPKDKDGWMVDSPLYSAMAIVFGLIWGLIIFNIDRFIVTSTGKGDGTEKITWDEFKGAIPRIIMGIIIAITISLPMEIRIFQTEIQAGLIEKKQEQEAVFTSGVDKRYSSRLKDIEVELTKLQTEINNKKNSYQLAINNAKSVCPSGGVSCPVATHRKLWSVATTEENDWNSSSALNQPKIIILNTEKDTLNFKKTIDLGGARKDGEQMDGLSERIKQMHKKVPWGTSLFITLLFLVIELTPIFFKLMLIKTPYDYMEENIKELIKAENGIEVKYNYYADDKSREGMEQHLVINHNVEKEIYQTARATEVQKELMDYAIAKYTEKMKAKIDANPEDYIKEEELNKMNPTEA